MNIQFYLNDVAVDAPANWQSLLIELNFDSDAPDARVTINEWEWIRENSDTINSWIADGLTGGVGIFEGIPFRIELGKSGTIEQLYNGYLDLSTSQIECNQVTATAKERLGIDYINDIADSFSFEYLNTKAKLGSNGQTMLPFTDRYVYVPYVISTVPSAQEAILAAVSLITLLIELQNALTSLLKHISGIATFSWSDLFKIVIHVAYIAFLFATIIRVIQDLFNAIIQPVKFHAGMKIKDLCEIGSDWMGFDFASETILELEEFADLVLLPQKYNMPLNDDIDFIQGFTNVASISQQATGSNQIGQNEENGYYNGTFGQLLRDLKTMFNAKVIIDDAGLNGRPTLRLERIDYSTSENLYNLPPIDNNDAYRFNVNDFKANYLVEFSLDSAEKNTFLEYSGTVYQSTAKPITIDNADLVIMKGLNSVAIPYALGKRKETLTVPEKVLLPIINEIEQIINSISLLINGVVFTAWVAGNVMLTQINNIIDAVNGLPGGTDIPNIDPNLLGDISELPFVDINNTAGDPNERIGMLLIENDFINVPKIIKLNTVAEQSTPPVITGTVLGFQFSFSEYLEFGANVLYSDIDYKANILNVDNATILSAENIYKKFHYINSFVPTDVSDTDDNPLTPQLHNQWKLYEFENVPFCFEDYLKVKNDNKIIFVDKFGLVEGIEWNIFNETAKITFRVNELYTLNLENVELIPLGR
tara:strand:- start:1392 stop:3506 length:2115 start_codon:yes stop_codon:yes gene_type:complete